MITTAILYTIYVFVYAITYLLRQFSDVSLPSNLSSSLAQIGGYLSSVQLFVPVGTMISVFGALLAIEGGIFAYKGIMWIIRRIPTQS
jgi:hypothetical protein